MPRKKKLPDSGEAEPEIATQEVEALHTVKYKTPMRVPLEIPPDETDDDEDEEIDLDEIEIEEEEKPKRRAPQTSFRNKIKQKFLDKGIGGGELIALRIDQLPNYAVDGISGINAEKIFRDALKVTEDYFDNESYLANILRKYGPGDYWLTARVKNSIVHNWLERIGAPVAASPVARTEGEVSSVAQQAFYPAPQPPPIAPKSLKEQLSEAVELLTLVRKIDGRSEANMQQTAPAPEVPKNVQMAAMLLEDPEVKTRAVKSLLGSAGHETDLTALLIENGPSLLKAAGEMLQGVIQQAVLGIDHIRSKNGQAQAGIPTHAAVQTTSPQESQSVLVDSGMQNVPIYQNGTQSPPGNANGQGFDPEQQLYNEIMQSGLEPSQYALHLVLGECRAKTPVSVAVDNLLNLENFIGRAWPHKSITAYIDLLADSPYDDIAGFLATIPTAQEILDMPHTKDWILAFQERTRQEWLRGGEDEEN